jgi:DNA primase
LKNVKKKQKAVPTLSEINEGILEIFCYYPWQPWTEDHISAEAMSQFEIGYYGYQHSLTIPHRDINGRLIGIRQRMLDDWDIENIGKYTPVQIAGKFLAHSLGNNIYGIHVVKDKVQRCKKIMLVESEKGAMQAYSYFGEDSFTASVCGSNLTRNQIKIILGLGVEEVMIAFDRMYHDAQSFEAELYLRKLIKLVAPIVPFVRVYLVLDNKNRIDYKQSPTDYGKETLVELMKEKTLVTMDMVREILEEAEHNKS